MYYQDVAEMMERTGKYTNELDQLWKEICELYAAGGPDEVQAQLSAKIDDLQTAFVEQLNNLEITF